MKRLIPFFVLALGLLYLASTWRTPQPEGEFDLNAFGQLPVLVNGRLKPIDTVARTSLLMFQGRQRVKNAEGKTLPPVAWLLDVLFRADLADRYRHFEIVHPDVLGLLNLTIEDGDAKKRFSFTQIAPKLEELDKQARLAEQTEAPARTPFQRAVVDLRDHVVLYSRLKHSLVPPTSSDVLADYTRFQNALPAGIAAVQAQQRGESHDDAAARELIQLAQQFDFMSRMGYLLAIPPGANTDDSNAWKSVGTALMDTFQTGQLNPHVMAYAGLAHSWRNQQAEQFNTIVKLHRDTLTSRFGERLTKSDAETRFNAAAPFYSSLYLYVLAFLLAIFSWLRWSDVLARSGFYLLTLAWIVTTVGIAIRMWLEGRPPVTNLYSSALFVGWGSAGLCLVLEAVYKNGIGTAAGGLVGFCTLLIAHHLSLSGDTLEMMRAVLDSNFWLATHVVVVTLGYSATYLAGFLAIIYIFRGVFSRSLDHRTADALVRMVYGIVCFATLFSLVGTVLGGIWADQSWGRFWGWDPKENGALIIVMWNAIFLHARWGGLAKARGLMALAVFGNVVTSWSWFGTNMLGVGLHSYGFMDEAFLWLVAFVVSQLAIIGLAYLPTRMWGSAANLHSPAATRP